MKPSASAFEAALAATNEYGIVEEVREALVLISGLPRVTLNEVIVFANNERGYVVSLGRDYVEALSLSPARVPLGSRVARVGKQLTVPLGEGLRGRVIDALGRDLLAATVPAYTTQERLIDIPPPRLSQREQVQEPLATGSSIVDLLLPLGFGQRQAVLGDQKTGKTSFLFSTLRAFAAQNVVIYTAIGKPASAIAEAWTFIAESGVAENVVLVAARASDVPSLIILTPFTAMTLAEYFRDLGRNVLVIFDDLTVHAQFYREVALLGRQFPGRESYPGDIFHLHARLLERAGNFVLPDGHHASITCLAAAETVRSDLTGYIVSNLISITDGHLLFDTTLFNQGRRPAIDETLSVTRVGLQTQPRLAKRLNRELTRLLARHARAAGYAHFGTELSDEVARLIDAGNKFKAFFSQPPYMTVPLPVQLVLAGMIWQNWLYREMDEAAGQWRDRLVQQYASSPRAREILELICSAEALPDFVRALEIHKQELLTLCRSEMILSER